MMRPNRSQHVISLFRKLQTLLVSLFSCLWMQQTFLKEEGVNPSLHLREKLFSGEEKRWYSQDYKQYSSFHSIAKSGQMEIQRFTESRSFIKVYIRRIQLHFQEHKCWSFLFRKGPDNQMVMWPWKKKHLRISGIFIINVQVGRNNTFQK